MPRKTALARRPRASTPTRSPRRDRAVRVEIDPALARLWKTTLAALQASSLEGHHAWDRKYESVGAILQHDPPLYLAGGLSTASEFVAKYLPGEDIRTVLRNVRVAQYASPEEEAKYTTSKIDAAITYLEARHGKPKSGRIPVAFEKLRLVTKGGTVSFPEATVEQVRTAARVASRTQPAKKPDPKRASVVAAVTALLPKDAKEVTVHYTDGRLSLGRIPVRAFAAVMRALAKAQVIRD
ncbi:MAG: hypothetical protein NVS3B10_06630 [Polyangiales bacterium]